MNIHGLFLLFRIIFFRPNPVQTPVTCTKNGVISLLLPPFFKFHLSLSTTEKNLQQTCLQGSYSVVEVVTTLKYEWQVG